MPTLYTPLGPISANKVVKKLLTPYKRGQITSAALFGYKVPEIARVLKEPKSTVQDTLVKDQLREEGESLPRSSRPKE